MDIIETEFNEVKIICSKKIIDRRGLYKINYSHKILLNNNIEFVLKEERIYNIKKNAFYGLHFQNNPYIQNKLIYLINGKGIDYIVDLRKKSKTYKKWIKIELDSKNNQMIYVPHGFGHGFLSMTENTIMSFKIDQYFENNYSKSIKYNDPELNMKIILDEKLLSDQDKNAPYLINSDCNL